MKTLMKMLVYVFFQAAQKEQGDRTFDVQFL